MGFVLWHLLVVQWVGLQCVIFVFLGVTIAAKNYYCGSIDIAGKYHCNTFKIVDYNCNTIVILLSETFMLV